MSVSACKHMCHGAAMGIRGQHFGIDFLLLSCGFWLKLSVLCLIESEYLNMLSHLSSPYVLFFFTAFVTGSI